MKAIILLSGGLDSTVMLAYALNKGRTCFAISFDYNQRHKSELIKAKEITSHYSISHKIITIDPLTFRGSSLTSDTPVPTNRSKEEIAASGTPSTYVPARNTLFLSYALGYAETLEAEEIYFGPNALDHNYPDCRKEFVDAFQGLAKVAISGKAPKLVTPLLHLDKAEIVDLGKRLNAPLNKTLSCYQPNALHEPCTICDACVLRKSLI